MRNITIIVTKRISNILTILSVVVIAGVFFSCHEDIECHQDYLVITIDKPKSIVDNGDSIVTRIAYDNLDTSFETGDEVGVYAWDGTAVVASNVRHTLKSDGTWKTSVPVPYNSTYTYYAYYPYRSDHGYTPANSGDADTRFATFISDAGNKFWSADQSTQAAYDASNLCVAQGSHVGSGNAVTFLMAHKRALVVFNGTGVLSTPFTGTNLPCTIGECKYFLMKPSISTTFTDEETGTYTLSALSGKYVTHAIALVNYNYFLTVTPPSSYTYSGGTNSYSVTSYKQNDEGTKTKVAAWTASYDTNNDGVFDDAKPSWLTTFTESGAGSTSATAYSATVAAQTPAISSSGAAASNTAILRSTSAVSNYDLSTKGGAVSRTTANCYMVHAPGTYKIPLVYGNAIKNGSTNSAAYNPTGTSSDDFLKPFVNHANAAITDPWIKNNSISISGAQLVWQDINGLVKNGSVTIDGDYLCFELPAATIAEGNAVIAITNSSSEIVWSWHIWVTREDYSTLTTINGYQITPINLGWIDNSSTTTSDYAARSCAVRISQPGGQSQTFDISQTAYTNTVASNGGYNPYYQWGRKDPMPPSTGSGNTNHTIYNISGSTVSLTFRTTYTNSTPSYQQNTIGYCIAHPLVMTRLSNSLGWGSTYLTHQDNLWDAVNTSDSNNRTTHTVKTIYDPCPPGFCLPSSGLFYYFENHPVKFTWNAASNGGIYSSLHIPASGMRHGYEGYAIDYVGTEAFLWSSTPVTATTADDECTAHYFWFNNKTQYEWNHARSDGHSVRPVAE